MWRERLPWHSVSSMCKYPENVPTLAEIPIHSWRKNGQGSGSQRKYGNYPGTCGQNLVTHFESRQNVGSGGGYVTVEKPDTHHLTQVVKDNKEKVLLISCTPIRYDEQDTSSLQCASPKSITPAESRENIGQTSTENSCSSKCQNHKRQGRLINITTYKRLRRYSN